MKQTGVYINNYRQKKTILKIISENIICIIRLIFNRIEHGKDLKTVLFYPQYPIRRSVVFKVLQTLKYNITNNPQRKHQLTIYWDNITYRKPDTVILELAEKEHVVNINCRDISKSFVEETFHKVFGYSYNLDCTSCTQPFVKKSEKNASHDGKIITGPVEPEEGFVYQKLINNSFNNELVVDIRVPIINYKIPLAFLKYKAKSTRFAHFRKSDKNSVEVYHIDKILSTKEIKNTIDFCKALGLEYGELDILRDIDDNRIYIIDANNTPTGPTCKKRTKKKSINNMAKVFKTEFIK